MAAPQSRTTPEPFVWLLFSAGGVVAALVLPVLLVLFGLAIPLGWVTAPDHAHLLAVLRNPLTRVGMLGICALALVHAAHRLRFTVEHAFQLRRADGIIATVCYGGALAGTVAAGLAWRELTPAVQYAATTPGDGYPAWGALVAETAITFLLVFTIFVCVNLPRVAPRTGLIAGALVAVLVMIEAPVSGTSLNPARTLGPAIVVPLYRDVWLYVVGPCLGALLAVAAYSRQWGRTTVCAKLYHTEKYPCPFDQCGYRLAAAGETVMREGEPGDEAYVVERGALDVQRGSGMSLARLGPGDWVGEMSLLLDEPRSATVVAASDVQLRRVTKQDFGRVLAHDPERTEELLRQLARRVKESSDRVAGRI
jgi:fumarate reductase subunit D